jgi:hypothetical protein
VLYKCQRQLFKNIPAGLYTIKYTITGYVDVLYFSPIAITNTTVLTSVTLTPGNAVYVSGTVGGNWTNNNVYYVVGDLNVPANTTAMATR